jgi:hypothetical protein
MGYCRHRWQSRMTADPLPRPLNGSSLCLVNSIVVVLGTYAAMSLMSVVSGWKRQWRAMAVAGALEQPTVQCRQPEPADAVRVHHESDAAAMRLDWWEHRRLACGGLQCIT